ncbi:MAG: hypothetical protein NVSMB58_32800 [Terriglobales bacterium]
MRHSKHQRTAKSLEKIATAGEVFADGSLIELVRDTVDPGRINLLKWNGVTATIKREFSCSARMYIPISFDSSILASMSLPVAPTSYESVREIFDELAQVFITFCALPQRYADLSAAFVLSTWFADCSITSPRLCAVGSSGNGVVQFLRVLGSLCRHGILIANAPESELIGMVTKTKPTVILYDREFRNGIRGFLLASEHSDFGLLRKNRLTNISCASAFYCSPHDQKSFRDYLQIPIAPVRHDLLPWAQDHNHIADNLQGKLLSYRLNNKQKFSKTIPELTDVFRSCGELPRLLAGFIVDDPELQMRILAHLRDLHQVVLVDRSWQVESLILEALLVACHEDERHSVHVGEVTEIVNEILCLRGEACKFKARKIGSRLTTLGLFSERGRNGYGFLLTQETRRRIHDLASTYDVPSLIDGMPGCDDCKHVRSNFCLEVNVNGVADNHASSGA